MDGRKISPFYRTLSLIGAAAPLQPKFNSKNCMKRGKDTADHMMPLGDWFYLSPSIPFFPFFPPLSFSYSIFFPSLPHVKCFLFHRKIPYEL